MMLVLLAVSVQAGSPWALPEYAARIPVNCSLISYNTPVAINGSGGISFSGSTQVQYIWSRCQGNTSNISVYYNAYNDYAVANDTMIVPFEVELGNVSSRNMTDIWVNYSLVMHGAVLLDSSPQKNNMVISAGTYVPYVTNRSKCAVGPCFAGDANTYFSNTTPTGLPTGENTSTQIIWSKSGSNSNDVKYLFGYGTDAVVQMRTMSYGTSVFKCNVFTTPCTKTIAVNTSTLNMNVVMFDAATLFISVNAGIYNGEAFDLNTKNTNLRIGSFPNPLYEFWFLSGSYGFDTLDEARIYNDNMSTMALTQIYLNVLNLKGYADALPSETPDAILVTITAINDNPINGSILNQTAITFGCNLTTTYSNLTQVNVNIYNRTAAPGAGFYRLLNLTANTKINGTYNLSTTLVINNAYNWNCYGQLADNTSFTSGNYSLYLEDRNPIVFIQVPINRTGTLTVANTLNYTAMHTTSGFIDSCWYERINSTGSLGNTTFVGCQNSTINLTNKGLWVIKVYANDSLGHIGEASVSLKKANITPVYPPQYAINSNFTVNVTVDTGIGTATTRIISNFTQSFYGGALLCSNTTLSTPYVAVMNCSPPTNTFFNVKFRMWTYVNDSDGYTFNVSSADRFYDNQPPNLFTFWYEGKAWVWGSMVTGSFNFSDNNLFWLNVTLDGKNLSDIRDINTTTFAYNLSVNASTLGLGNHSLRLIMWDSHTGNVIPTYDVSKQILSNTLTFNTKANKININAADEDLNLKNPWNTEKLVDRYTFAYTPTKALSSYTFMVTTEQPLYIINKPTSIYKTWIVSGTNWLDFYKDGTEIVTITKEGPKTARITVTNPGSKAQIIRFNSIGELNNVTMDTFFYTYNVTTTTTPVVFETQIQTNLIKVYYPGLPPIVYQAAFIWNNTQYTWGVNYVNSTELMLNSTFITPVLNRTVTVSNRWGFNLSTNITWNANDTLNIVGSQIVNNLSVIECPAGVKVYTALLNLQFWPTLPVSSNVDYRFTYWLSDRTVNVTTSKHLNTVQNFSICISNASLNPSADIYVQYESLTGFMHRWYLNNFSISTTERTDTLYGFNTTTGISRLILNVQHGTDYSNYADVYVKLLQYYTSEDVWRIVQMQRSPDLGTVGFNVIEDNLDYKLEFYDVENHLLKTTNTLTFQCSAGLCDLTALLYPYQMLTEGGHLVSNYTINQTTRNITYSWYDSMNVTRTLNFLVSHTGSAGQNIYPCNITQTGNNGTWMCDLSLLNSEGIIYKWADGKLIGSDSIKWNSTQINSFIDEQDGMFWSIGIFLTVIVAGLISPALLVTMTVIGLWVISISGVSAAITWPMIGVAAAIGLLLNYKVRN